MHDVRYPLRLMARQPMFACLVVGTLTLGIGASTSMFSVVNGVLLEPLPYADPQCSSGCSVRFEGAIPRRCPRLTSSTTAARPDAFQSIGAMAISPAEVTVAGAEAPARFQASCVSAALMTTLGVAPIAGHDFTTGCHNRWLTASDVLGRAIVIDDRPHTIVGVMPAGFTLPYDSFIRLTEPVDLYLPVAFDDPEAQIRRFHSLRLIGG